LIAGGRLALLERVLDKVGKELTDGPAIGRGHRPDRLCDFWLRPKIQKWFGGHHCAPVVYESIGRLRFPCNVWSAGFSDGCVSTVQEASSSTVFAALDHCL